MMYLRSRGTVKFIYRVVAFRISVVVAGLDTGI